MEKHLRKAHGQMHRSLKCLDNKILKTVLYILAIGAAVCLIFCHSLPTELCALSENNIARAVAVLLVLYIAIKDIWLAALLAIAFILLIRACGNTQMASVGGDYIDNQDAGEAPAPENIFGEDSAMPSPSVSEEEDSVYREFIESQVENNDVTAYNTNETDDCLQLCTDDSMPSGGRNDQCSGVATWDNEMNAQGLNCPLGEPATSVGAPF